MTNAGKQPSRTWDRNVQTHFNKLAPVYDKRKETKYYQEIEKIVKDYIPKECFILDVCCAAGKLLRDLFETGVGIDFSSKLISFAHERSKKHIFIVADAKYLPFKDHTFPGITCIDLFEHVDNLDAVITEISRVIKNRGVLVATSPNPSYNSILHLLELLKLKLPEGPHKWRNYHLTVSLLSENGFSCKVVKAYYNLIHAIIGVKE